MTHEKWLIIRKNHLKLFKSNTIECWCSQKRRSRWTNGRFWLWVSFFPTEKWDSQLLCHFRSLKRIENAIVALMLSTNVTFLILEVCVRQTEGPVNVFLVSCLFPTSFTWNSGHNFYPDFFSTLITNWVHSAVFGLTRLPVGLARFSAPSILKPLESWVFWGFHGILLANGVVCME